MWERARQRRRATAWERDLPGSLTAEAAGDEAGSPLLEAGRLYRGVSGVDPEPRPMSAEEIARLGDPMATVTFRRGRFPMTVHELLAEIDRSGTVPEQKVFMIGEAGQIPPQNAPQLRRDLRFTLTRAERGSAPDLLISTAATGDPADGFLQVIAWDPVARVFNYYMRITPAWVWTGDSWAALAPESRGKGCFDSHVNGSVVMKELKQPWGNWQSMAAQIQLAPSDPLRADPLYRQVRGAEELEPMIRALVSRWTGARLEAVIADGVLRRPDQLLRQLFTGTSVNLASALTQSAAVSPGQDLVLPLGFWLNADALVDDLGLDVTAVPPSVPGALYLDSLIMFDFRLEEKTSGFSQEGDTFFAFVVPEAAYEDNDVANQMVRKGLVSAKFAACALMVDFPSPVFSPDRARLMTYVPAEATPIDALDERIAEAIVTAAGRSPAGSPERRFAAGWALPDDRWRAEFGSRLSAYLEKAGARIRTADGFGDYVRLAESRRRDFKMMRLNEFELTLPATGIPEDAPRLRMTEDATVATRP
ncbi:hypothetical protein HS041_30235 [Planomonospora sp. ID67723]|uniref:hypothetical protein n=1 Tax=Planomonospora sp. ID67723 TaxID=2738134 RepID=UPI0018C36D0B|nr:hypothetical protein [Planomonospora sp. ID67723]MBG0831987.1 hypothetical protein [Planomonospora sp. ID67723]